MGQFVSHLSGKLSPAPSTSSLSSSDPLLKEEKEIDASLNFPFLKDEEAIDYYRSTKIMLVLRGLPGSGKTFLATHLKKQYLCNVEVCSVNDFFISEDGHFEFRPTLLRSAHAACEAKALAACEKGRHLVVVDAINARHWDLAPYLAMAQQHGYLTLVIEPRTAWRFDPVECAARSEHGTALRIVESKLSQWEPLLPIYYGWFINDCDSHNLTILAASFLEQCLNVQEFACFFEKLLLERECSDLQEYFGLHKKIQLPSHLLHCTAKYLGGGGDREAREKYEIKASAHYGLVSTLRLSALCITPRTLCFQVALSSKQREVWGYEEDEPVTSLETNGGENSDINELGYPLGSKPVGRTNEDIAAEVAWPLATASLATLHLLPPFLVPEEELKVETSQKICRAHITVGTAPSISPVQSGIDLLATLSLEKINPPSLERFLPGGGRLLRYQDSWLIIFQRPFRVKALFTSFLSGRRPQYTNFAHRRF